MEYSRVTPDVVEELAKIVGRENVRTDEDTLEKYSRDETSGIEPHLPEIVVYPTSAEQISGIMKIANERLIPVTPRGAGTGLSGGAVPVYGGIILSLERMDRIIELDVESMTITVEPGVITGEIQKVAEEHGLYYAGDPASSESSSIGGNVAENAGGTRVIKYGPTGYHVVGIEMVTPTGEIVRYGGKMLKNVMGYDIIRLIVGSEGTLGIVTKITLRLVPKPKYLATLLVPFPTIDGAIGAVSKVIPSIGTIPTSIEFMDRPSVEMASRFLRTAVPNMEDAAHLILEVDSPIKGALSELYMKLGDEMMKTGASEVYIADNRHQRERIWRFRKAIAEGIIAFRPVHCMEDVSVPMGKISDLVRETYEIAGRWGIEVLNFGHVGDGNVHVTFLKPSNVDEAEWRGKLDGALEDLYDLTSSLGGVMTGEHGVGIKRRKFMKIFLSEEEIDLMRRIKKAFDPNMILNPGKIF